MGLLVFLLSLNYSLFAGAKSNQVDTLVTPSALAYPVELISEEKIEGQTGELINLTVRLKNNTDSIIDAILQIRLNPNLRVIGDVDRLVNLPAQSSRYVSFRIRIESSAPSDSAMAVNLQVIEKQKPTRRLAQSSSQVSVKAFRKVLMQSLSQHQIMQFPGDSIQIPIYVRNAGNTTETVRLVTATPVAQGNAARLFEAREFALRPSQDTTVRLSFVVDKQMLNYELFFVNITGLYENADIFGNAHIAIQNGASKRSYNNTAFEYDIWSTQQNQLVFSTRDFLQGRQNWQLQARALHRIPNQNASVSYSLNMQQWNADAVPVINNTWFRYEKNNKGFTIGNISESLEKHIYGRGITLHKSNVVGTAHSGVGIVDKGYNLIGNNTGDSWFEGITAFVKHTSGTGTNSKFQYNTLGLYDRDPYENAESLIYTNTIQWIPDPLDRRTSIQFHLGAGLTKPIEPIEDQSNDQLKPSIATSIIANSHWRNYAFSTSNYYSTGYYPGTRRGILQSNSRISKKLNNMDQWVALNLSNYEPTYFATRQSFPIFFSQLRAEMGLSLPLSSFLNFSISPRFENERGRYFYQFHTPQLLKQQSAKIQSMLNWRSRNNRHFASISQDFGWITSSNFSPNETFQIRSILSYSFQRLNISANYQYGNFTVNEQLYGIDDRVPSRTSLNVNFSDRFFQRKLQFDLGTSLYDDRHAGTGLAGSSRMQYNFKRTAVFVHAQLFNYYNSALRSEPTIYTQVGIIHKLPDGRKSTAGKRGRMTFFTFFDHNNNGVYDAGDEVATSKSIMVNNTMFLSDHRGEIKYTQVPYNSYKLSVPVEKGWHAPTRTITLDNKKMRWEIPLQRSGTVRGSIRFNYDPRLSLETNTSLEGFSVTATGKNGLTFTTRSDNRGNFQLFLPIGEFEISLNEKEFPPHVYTETPKVKLEVIAGKVNEVPDFELKVKRKTIEIKRFGSE